MVPVPFEEEHSQYARSGVSKRESGQGRGKGQMVKKKPVSHSENPSFY
jgi:hypothetical protein